MVRKGKNQTKDVDLVDVNAIVMLPGPQGRAGSSWFVFFCLSLGWLRRPGIFEVCGFVCTSASLASSLPSSLACTSHSDECAAAHCAPLSWCT